MVYVRLKLVQTVEVLRVRPNVLSEFLQISTSFEFEFGS